MLKKGAATSFGTSGPKRCHRGLTLKDLLKELLPRSGHVSQMGSLGVVFERPVSTTVL
jgi:hypothetical protein